MEPDDWEALERIWSLCHPVDATEELESEDEGIEPPAEIPTIDNLPLVVDYSTRAPGDFVISGPCGDGRGKGRYFRNHGSAYQWAATKYGLRRVSRVEAGEFRWAVLVKAASTT